MAIGGTATSDGAVLVISGGQQDSPDWTAYSLASGQVLTQDDNNDPNFSSACGVGVVERGDGIHVVLTISAGGTAASGVNNGSTTSALVATNAITGKRLWQTPLDSSSGADGDIDCGSLGASGGTPNDNDTQVAELQTSPSLNMLLFSDDKGPALVNLDSGHLEQLGSGTAMMLGPAVAVRHASGSTPMPVELFTANTGAEVGMSTVGLLPNCLARDPGYGGCPVITTATALVWVTNVGSESDDNGALVAVSARTLKTLWRIPDEPGTGGAAQTTLAAASPVLVETATDDGGGSTVTALNTLTGKTVWHYNAQYCGSTNGYAYVIANDELATLNAATGKQLSVDSSESQCPLVVDSALVDQENSGENKVVPQPAGGSFDSAQSHA